MLSWSSRCCCAVGDIALIFACFGNRKGPKSPVWPSELEEGAWILGLGPCPFCLVPSLGGKRGKGVFYIGTDGSIHFGRWESFPNSNWKEVEEGSVCLQGRSRHFWFFTFFLAPLRLCRKLLTLCWVDRDRPIGTSHLSLRLFLKLIQARCCVHECYNRS